MKMENNNKDISNDLNEVNQQPNKYSSLESEKGKKNIIIVVIVCILATVVLGICLGIVFSKKEEDKVVVPEKTVEEKVETEKENEVKSGKKLDEDRAWVYDADYAEGKKIKKVGSDSFTVNTKDNIKVPYININSDDAKATNDEIKKLYEKAYSEFSDGEVGNIYEIKYNYYENGNILSIVIDSTNALVPGGAGREEMYVYNFSLDTLKMATLEEMAKLCGFSSGGEIIEKVRKWEKTQVEIYQANQGTIAATFDGAETGKYFIGNDGKFNFVYRLTAAGSFLTAKSIEVDKDIENIFELPKKSYFEENANSEFSTAINDDNNGKVALLRMGEKKLKTEELEGYYVYRDEYNQSYNIKEVTSIKSVYVDTSITNDVALFKCTIEYVDNNNSNSSFDVAVLLESNFSGQELVGTFDSFSGSTRCNKMFGQYSFLYEGVRDFQASSGEYATSVKNKYELYYTIKTREINGIMVTSTADGKSVVIHIDDISIKNSNSTADTTYTEFAFKGYEDGTYKVHTGTGSVSLATNGNSYNVSLDLAFDTPIMEVTNIKISGSTEGYINLVNQND